MPRTRIVIIALLCAAGPAAGIVLGLRETARRLPSQSEVAIAASDPVVTGSISPSSAEPARPSDDRRQMREAKVLLTAVAVTTFTDVARR